MRMIFIFFALLFSTATVNAQHDLHPCGVGADFDVTWLRDFQQNPEKYPMTKNDELIIAALQVHNVGNDNGTGLFAWRQMLDALCQLQNDFADSDIQFYLSNGINEIYNTEWNQHETFGEGSSMLWNESVDGLINTFLTSDAAGNCGYYSPGPDATVVAKSCAGATDDTWAHEIGHFLSLPHPFFGWEGVDYNPSTLTSTYSSDVFTPIENVNGDNCAFAADGFCDTAPDYISNRWNCNDEEVYGSTFTDLNGEEFNVDGTLFMSYANDICAKRFSDEQITAMRANLEFERPEVILDNVTIEEISVGDFTPIYPVEGETVPFNYVKLEWEPIEFATHYYVRASLEPWGVTLFRGMTETTEFVLDELTANREYSFEVRPFNWGYFCAGYTEKVFFSTDETTAVNTIEGVESINIYPTLVQQGASINIDFATVNALTGVQVDIIDLSGKNVFYQDEQIIAGENNLVIQPSSLQKGMYFLRISSDQGSFAEKILVQ